MQDLEPHRSRIARALTSLEAALDQFIDALAHQPLWIAVDGATSDRDARRRAGAAYRTIDYAMDDDVRTTQDCVGVIRVSTDVLARAQRVNAAKAAFKRVCVPLGRIRTRVPTRAGQGGDATEMVQLIRVILRSLQRSDLNLTAAYRKIPILAGPPSSVAYVRARTRAVYRKRVEDLQTLLMTRDHPNAAKDRARLGALRPTETHLALVHERYDSIRANVVYEKLDKRGRGRVQVRAELPLLYAASTRAQPEPPTVRFPEPAADSSSSDSDAQPRATRKRQSKLEPDPYLQSLPVYRYAPSH